MLISIHIPKTAGTTLAAYLAKAYPHSILYDYDAMVVKNDPEYILKHTPIIDRFEVIHGHFFYKKYGEIYPDATYMTCVRNPVDRIISNYFHVMREKNMSTYSYRRIVEDKLDIVGFASLPNMSRAQYLHLEGRGIYHYNFIAITERMDEAIPMLSRFLGKPIILEEFRKEQGKTKRINANTKKKKISQDIRDKIAEACPIDIEIYRRALEKFESLKKNLLK